MAFEITYSPEAVDHLSSLSTPEQVLVLDQVEFMLSDVPALATRKRKLLRPNPVAPWVLRLGDIRVFYEVQQELSLEVVVKAIGKKVHNELWIGGEKVVI